MTFKIYDSNANLVELTDIEGQNLLSYMVEDSDPRVSACIDCRSCVLATDPFQKLVEELQIQYSFEAQWISDLSALLEDTTSVHIYILEDNDCLHRLWRDPLATEWSEITGEKRFK